jgi:uncharacterized YccA/Bax inhibitor family protein
MALRQPNPVLSKSFRSEMETPESSTPMTMEGTVNKTGFLLVILGLASASVYFGPSGLVNTVASMYIVLVLATVGIAIGVAVRPHLAKNLAVSYAVIEGLLLGTLSRMLNSELPGIGSQALMLTFGIAAGMLFIYKAKIIEVTKNFRIAVTAATLGVAFLYLVSLFGRFIGFEVPYLHDNSAAGIAVSLAIVALAAANLALDFDFVETGVRDAYPQRYEWVAAFGLVVTLAWLYVEVLRLLSKIRSDD